MSNRKIVGAVLQGGHFYKAGDEDALATAMKGRSMEHLVEKGVITGDWGVKKATAAPSSTDSTDTSQSEETQDSSSEDLAEGLAANLNGDASDTSGTETTKPAPKRARKSARKRSK
jgi:hypothetical protein